MDNLSDEVLVSIFCALDDPTPLTLVSRRLHAFSAEPYVRACYFIRRHGYVQAFYWALTRSKLLNERVIDVLLSSGAHLSRYLLQCVAGHAFRKAISFIRGRWSKSLAFPALAHLLKVGAELYPDVAISKGDDDGAVFQRWIGQQKNPGVAWSKASVAWETVEEMFQKYKFMPFSPKDPIHIQLPLALALEPRLLPLAVANGFDMDHKYRDFIFRKMFEKPFTERDNRAEEIVQKVRAICRIDDSLFVSRTVAAEICMEANTNEEGYKALGILHRAGDLRFSLNDLIVDLLKLFPKTRSVTNPATVQNLHNVWQDFPSSDNASARHVLLLTVFCVGNGISLSTSSFVAKLETLGLLPITHQDVLRVLTNPFLENPAPILRFAHAKVAQFKSHEYDIIGQVMRECLVSSCKGKMLKRLYDSYPRHRDLFLSLVRLHKIDSSRIPSWCNNDDLASTYRAVLNDDFGATVSALDMYSLFDTQDETPSEMQGDLESFTDDAKGDTSDSGGPSRASTNDDIHDPVLIVDLNFAEESHALSSDELGPISQDTLTSRIQSEESGMHGMRRRWWHRVNANESSRLPYANDAKAVGRWVREQFGARHEITAIFLTHAIVNGNVSILSCYFEPAAHGFLDGRVPITLEHFEILARLGRNPSPFVWSEVETDATFYFTEDDYLNPTNSVLRARIVASESELENVVAKRMRPQRAVAAARSYAEPGSDDEIEGVKREAPGVEALPLETQTESTSLHKWITHLTALQKAEEQKWKDKRRAAERDDAGKLKHRVPKSDFLQALTVRLREFGTLLRSRHGMSDTPVATDSAEEDYILRPAKRRRKA